MGGRVTVVEVSAPAGEQKAAGVAVQCTPETRFPQDWLVFIYFKYTAQPDALWLGVEITIWPRLELKMTRMSVWNFIQINNEILFKSWL